MKTFLLLFILQVIGISSACYSQTVDPIKVLKDPENFNSEEKYWDRKTEEL
jgi:hypothetical protein